MGAIDRNVTDLLVGTAVSANGNLFANYGADGIAGLIGHQSKSGFLYLCIQKTGTGTATMTPQTSFDHGVTFYSAGFQPVDNQATLTRTVTALSITANGFNHVYQILDQAPYYQFVVSAVSGTVAITPYLYFSTI